MLQLRWLRRAVRSRPEGSSGRRKPFTTSVRDFRMAHKDAAAEQTQKVMDILKELSQMGSKIHNGFAGLDTQSIRHARRGQGKLREDFGGGREDAGGVQSFGAITL